MLDHEIDRCMSYLDAALQEVSGWLAPREVRFLATLAAFPTAAGEILELGPFEGKSTITLAIGAQAADRSPLTTIDIRVRPRLQENLDFAHVRDNVEVLEGDSKELTQSWDRPLRLLWHDGANDEETVNLDLFSLIPHLQEGGIVAIHDVLNHSGERIRSFCNFVLESGQFGAAGVVGSIGWAQKTSDPSKLRETADDRAQLARKLRRLFPYHNFHGPQTLSAKLHYKLQRARVPHRLPSVEQFCRQVA